jgi:hypothetical protein
LARDLDRCRCPLLARVRLRALFQKARNRGELRHVPYLRIGLLGRRSEIFGIERAQRVKDLDLDLVPAIMRQAGHLSCRVFRAFGTRGVVVRICDKFQGKRFGFRNIDPPGPRRH